MWLDEDDVRRVLRVGARESEAGGIEVGHAQTWQSSRQPTLHLTKRPEPRGELRGEGTPELPQRQQQLQRGRATNISHTDGGDGSRTTGEERRRQRATSRAAGGEAGAEHILPSADALKENTQFTERHALLHGGGKEITYDAGDGEDPVHDGAAADLRHLLG